MKSKRTAPRFLAALALLAALAIPATGCRIGDAIRAIVIDDVDFSMVRDGIYAAEQANVPITARVAVTVAGGRVRSIQVLSHRHGPGRGAEAVTERVIAAQSLRVDAVSGATSSSKVMLAAIERALEQGL
jgi:uncharacterized protein with FMN-binding domain